MINRKAPYRLNKPLYSAKLYQLHKKCKSMDQKRKYEKFFHSFRTHNGNMSMYPEKWCLQITKECLNGKKYFTNEKVFLSLLFVVNLKFSCWLYRINLNLKPELIPQICATIMQDLPCLMSMLVLKQLFLFIEI